MKAILHDTGVIEVVDENGIGSAQNGGFCRSYLEMLREHAWKEYANPDQNPLWRSAYWSLVEAADRLVCLQARCTVGVAGTGGAGEPAKVAGIPANAESIHPESKP